MKKILILGYYNRNNLGDDVFEYIFDQFLKQKIQQFQQFDIQYTIRNLDNVETVPPDTDLILFGGGDLINDYFIHKLNIINSPKVCPTYAVGIGIPYPKLIDEHYLDPFDVIIHRNKHDHTKLRDMYGEHRVKHFPDLSMLLPRYQPNETPEGLKLSPTHSYLPEPAEYQQKRIGVCLARSIYSPKDPSKYRSIIENLATFFLRVATIEKKKQPFFKCLGENETQYEYEIVFIPFCTDENSNQNDNLINEDVYTLIQQFQRCYNVKLVTKRLEITQITNVFTSFDLTVCTRFHSHVFSAMCNVPMLSVYSSRKVDNFLEELNLTEYAYQMDIDPEGMYPIKLNNEKLMKKFNHLINNYNKVVKDLENYNNLNVEKLDTLDTTLQNLIYYPIYHYLPQKIHALGKSKSSNIIDAIVKYFNINDNSTNISIDEIVMNDGGVERLIKNAGIAENDTTKYTLANIMSFILTKNKVTEYNYGISENILSDKYNLFNSCKWILNDYQQRYDSIIQYNNLDNYIPFKYRKLNMNFMVQHGLKGYHRSGWNFVLQNFRRLHNPSHLVPVFDSYLDRTFGWDYDFLTNIGFLPYVRKWVGVFHHTPHQEYSEHNLVEIFKKPLFIESLSMCKMLIVFSDYLKKWIDEQLTRLKINNVSVVMVYHPTQQVDKCLHFNYSNYIRNKHKKVIHIGAWLRNTYAIYELHVPKRFSKCALKGKAMDNYFIDNETVGCITDSILRCVNRCNYDGKNVSGNVIISRDAKKVNKYGVGLIDLIRKNHYSVEVIDRVSNEKYDQMLVKNIVFVNLVDASAVNTIIECIARNTPILVNRLPATVQYLGENYPLFYSSLEHAKRLIEHDANIYKAYCYLKAMDKTKFTMISCIKQLINSDAYKSIEI